MLVDGPVLVVRLVSGEQVLYLFGDYHLSEGEQTECAAEGPSLRVDSLLKKLFLKDRGRKIGFFCETSAEDLLGTSTALTKMYVLKVMDLFHAGFRLRGDGGRVRPSEAYPNVMFHHFDTRGTSNLDPHYPSHLEPVHGFYLDRLVRQVRDFVAEEWERQNRDTALRKVRGSRLRALRGLHSECAEDVSSFMEHASVLEREVRATLGRLREHEWGPAEARREVAGLWEAYRSALALAMNKWSAWSDLVLFRRLVEKDYGCRLNVVYAGNTHVLMVLFLLLKHTDYRDTHSTRDLSFVKSNLERFGVRWFTDHHDEIVLRVMGVYDNLGSGFKESPPQCVDLGGFPEVDELDSPSA